MLVGGAIARVLLSAPGLAAPHRLRKQAAVERDGGGRVVVAGHRVGDEARVGARVDDRGRRDVQFRRLDDGAVLAEDGIVRADHDAEVWQARDGAVEARRVGEGAAAPPPAVRVLAAGTRCPLDQRQRLRRVRDEQHDTLARGDVCREVERRVQSGQGEGEVDDVDPETTAEEVRLHVRVAHAALVADVDARREQLAHVDELRHAEEVGGGQRVYGGDDTYSTSILCCTTMHFHRKCSRFCAAV